MKLCLATLIIVVSIAGQMNPVMGCLWVLWFAFECALLIFK